MSTRFYVSFESRKQDTLVGGQGQRLVVGYNDRVNRYLCTYLDCFQDNFILDNCFYQFSHQKVLSLARTGLRPTKTENTNGSPCCWLQWTCHPLGVDRLAKYVCKLTDYLTVKFNVHITIFQRRKLDDFYLILDKNLVLH